MDCLLVAAWQGHTAGGFQQPCLNVTVKLLMSGNPLIGKSGNELDGLEALCGVVHMQTEWDMSNTKAMNVDATMVVAKRIDWDNCKLMKISLDSTGEAHLAQGEAKTYSLHMLPDFVLSRKHAHTQSHSTTNAPGDL